MAPHSSTLAWKIPWMEEPGGLRSMGVAMSQIQLSVFTFTFHFHALEKAMATHSSVLAWRIPGTGEPGGLPSIGSQSRTRLKRLSSSSSSYCKWLMHITFIFYYFIQWSHASSIFDSTLRSDDVFNKYLKRNLGWFWNNFIENLISTSF